MKKLTAAQMKLLSKYEENMTTATRSNWARGVGPTAVREIHDIFDYITEQKTAVHTNCAGCILNLLKKVGAVYFKQKEAEARRVAKKEGKAETVKNAKVTAEA